MELSEGVTGRGLLDSPFKKLRKKRAVAEIGRRRGVDKRIRDEERKPGKVQRGEKVVSRGGKW